MSKRVRNTAPLTPAPLTLAPLTPAPPAPAPPAPPAESLAPTTVLEIASDPHAKVVSKFSFYDTKSSTTSVKNAFDVINVDTGEVDITKSILLLNKDFELTGEASVAKVTKSIIDVIKELNEQYLIPSRRLDLTNIDESITKGRAGVESTYKVLYEFIIKLISAGKYSINIGTLASSPLYSYFIGPSAIKAILDSGPLGEGVLSAIDNNLCSCFEKLSIVEQDLTDYLKIFKELDKTSWKATQSDIIKFIDFWIVIEYCRVFQLVSSDVLGAVNGFIPLRAIIDHTGFTGFITIPKGNGGVLGIDNKICAYALFLNGVLYGQSGGFLTGTDDVAEYLEMITLFTDQINASNIFLNRFGEKGHENIIHSVKSFIEVLKTKNDGSLRGTYDIKDYKFVMAYNTYKIITLFAAFIENNDSFFEKIIDKIKSSYDPKEDTNIKSPAIKSSRDWITWMCFQLSRYQQTQKVFDKVTYDPPIPINNDYKNIIDSFEERRIKYCSYIKKNRKKYLEAWYKSLQEVYINEAFAGHDNNSYELTLAATKAFGENSPISQWLKPFITPKANAKGNEIYREDPEKVIKKILQETRCIPLLESYFSPDNIHNWALGNFGPKFINDREYDKTKTKFPVFNPTMEVLDIITGIKGSGLNSTTFIVVDLAKYVPDSISIQRSIEQVNARDNIDTADDIFDANIFFRNKLIEKKIIDNITTSTVYAPIIYGVDAAAFKLPQDAVYITGELKLPIDVGNGIKMVITFTTGETDKKLYKLISDKPEQIEVTQGFENYAMSLNYLYKNTINNPPEQLYGKNILTKETYRPYIIDLYNNINSVKYETFLKAVIPKFPKNKYKEIFTTNTQRVGNFWADFIKEIIEKENVYIARAFIETIIDNKDLYTNSIVISKWKKTIDNFIKTIEEHKYNTFESSDTLMSAKLQTLITTNKILFCKCKIENGDIKFEIATYEDVKQHYPEEIAKLEQKSFDAGVIEGEHRGIAEAALLLDTHDLKRPLDADADADTDNNPSKKPRIDIADITSVEGLENDISSTEGGLQENTSDLQTYNDQLIRAKNTDKKKPLNDLIKLTKAENLELVDKLDILQKQMTAITTLVSLKGAPVGGGLEDTNIEANPNIEEFNQLKEEIKNLDEERKKIDIKLAELKQQKEEIKINMLTITDEPLTEVDLAKTFLLLGPELYEKLAIIEVKKINSIYNKVLSLNVDNIPIDVTVPQSDIILQDNLSMIELENTIVAVKFKDGKYYIESAEKYLQPEQGTLPTTLVEVQEVLTDALTGVKDAVETGYEKLTDAVSPMVVDEGIVEDFETVSPMAAAAGGSKKHTKKHKSHIKKFTKRKYNKQKLNHTNRKGRKKAKRTFRKKKNLLN